MKKLYRIALAILVSPLSVFVFPLLGGAGVGLAQTISTIAGTGAAGYSGDGGPAGLAQLNLVNGIALDSFGNIYVADTYNNRIRKVDGSTGIITTVAGNGVQGYSGDGGIATSARLFGPTGVAFDALGNFFITDYNNCRIRKVNISTGIITTVGGSGICGYSGDGGAATLAQINSARKMAFDKSGNLYFSDEGNNVIRKINISSGIILTIVGNGTPGYNGDGGPAGLAKLNQPRGVSFDKIGNMYIGDIINHRVRKVNISTGIITTVAGSGVPGYSGDGGQAALAQLNGPEEIAVDALNNIYITDGNNNRIRKVDMSTGVISTFAGNGIQGYSGDGGSAVFAALSSPGSVLIDTVKNNMYISDTGNWRIRKINDITNVIKLAYTPVIIVYPNPAADKIFIELKDNSGEASEIKVFDLLGNTVKQLNNPWAGSGQAATKKTSIDISELQNGVYFVSVKNTEGSVTKKIIVQH